MSEMVGCLHTPQDQKKLRPQPCCAFAFQNSFQEKSIKKGTLHMDILPEEGTPPSSIHCLPAVESLAKACWLMAHTLPTR